MSDQRKSIRQSAQSCNCLSPGRRSRGRMEQLLSRDARRLFFTPSRPPASFAALAVRAAVRSGQCPLLPSLRRLAPPGFVPAALPPQHCMQQHFGEDSRSYRSQLDRRFRWPSWPARQLEPFTVQRLFKQALGVSPLQYQRALRRSACAARSNKRNRDQRYLQRRIRLIQPRYDGRNWA